MTRRAMFIGRWQPFHFGHDWLINQKLSQGVPCLVAIRDIPPDEKNPLTAQEAKEIIEKRYENDDVVVLIIPDIESVNWGRGVGYDTIEHSPPADIGRISATEIRKLHAAGDESWKEKIPENIHELVVKYLCQ